LNLQRVKDKHFASSS